MLLDELLQPAYLLTGEAFTILKSNRRKPKLGRVAFTPDVNVRRL